MHCTVRHCIVLHCITLYCRLPHSTSLYRIFYTIIYTASYHFVKYCTCRMHCRHFWIENATAFNHAYSDTGLFGIYGSAHPSKVADLVFVLTNEIKQMAGAVEWVGESRFAFPYVPASHIPLTINTSLMHISECQPNSARDRKCTLRHFSAYALLFETQPCSCRPLITQYRKRKCATKINKQGFRAGLHYWQ